MPFAYSSKWFPMFSHWSVSTINYICDIFLDYSIFCYHDNYFYYFPTTTLLLHSLYSLLLFSLTMWRVATNLLYTCCLPVVLGGCWPAAPTTTCYSYYYSILSLSLEWFFCLWFLLTLYTSIFYFHCLLAVFLLSLLTTTATYYLLLTADAFLTVAASCWLLVSYYSYY